MVKLSLAERREQFLILLGAFIIAILILGGVLYYTENDRYSISKEDLALRIEDDLRFEDAAQQALRYVDTASNQIKRFDPSVQAVFIETDIKKSFSDMNALFVRNDYDTRYSIFAESATLYDNYFIDRREMKGNLNDLERISANLDECILNRKQLQQTINMMNAR